MVQDFTVLPFTITVHAPQLLVSQPMCVPVCPSASRIKWTSNKRDSAMASRSLPLILILISSFFAIGASSVASFLGLELLLAGALQSTDQRAFGQLFDEALLVLCRAAQVSARL